MLAIADFLEYRITPHELRPDLYPNPCDALPDGVERECRQEAAA